MAANPLSNINLKLEGTAQTYGQAIVIASQGTTATSVQPTTNQQNPSTTITLLNASNFTVSLNNISQNDFSSIALAAAAKSKIITINPINIPSNDASAAATNNASNQTQVTPQTAVVLGSAWVTTPEVQSTLQQSANIDISLSLRSKFSEVIQFNNLQEQVLTSDFTYQFYIPEEEDIASQEDQSQDPLLTTSIINVPRFVTLSWNSVTTKVPIQTKLTNFNNQQNNTLLTQATSAPMGTVGLNSYSFANSFAKKQKTLNLQNVNGQAKEITDLQGKDVAFNSVGNVVRFTNTISLVLNTDNNILGVGNIPVK